jgi:hypothetical protein
MAVEQLLPIGVGEASSSEFVVGQQDHHTLCLNDDEGPGVARDARVRIELKDLSGRFFEVGFLFTDASGGKPVLVVSGPGTYRVTRLGIVPCGVFRTT